MGKSTLMPSKFSKKASFSQENSWYLISHLCFFDLLDNNPSPWWLGSPGHFFNSLWYFDIYENIRGNGKIAQKRRFVQFYKLNSAVCGVVLAVLQIVLSSLRSSACSFTNRTQQSAE